MKKRISILLAIFAAVLVGSVTSISKAEAPKQLRFGLLPAEDAIELVKEFQGIADHLGKTMGLPTKVWVSQRALSV